MGFFFLMSGRPYQYRAVLFSRWHYEAKKLLFPCVPLRLAIVQLQLRVTNRKSTTPCILAKLVKRGTSVSMKATNRKSTAGAKEWKRERERETETDVS